jgi:hypothetical protein
MLDWRGTLFSLASRSARSPESGLAKRKYGAAKKEGVYNKNAFSAAPEDALANVLPNSVKALEAMSRSLGQANALEFRN